MRTRQVGQGKENKVRRTRQGGMHQEQGNEDKTKQTSQGGQSKEDRVRKTREVG